MDDRGAIRELVQQLGLAAVGAVSLTAERADRLADELAGRGGMRRDEVRAVIEDSMGHWRAEAGRVGDRAGALLADVLADLGLVTKEQYEELELRLAQLEHRLRLLEPPVPGSNGPPPRA
jgi:polyhydroxyalkanoate synthesis regulator phasin